MSSMLHPRLKAAVKAATRRAIDAMPAVGETQRQAAARVCGVGVERFSRWCSDEGDELITFAAAIALEREAQVPIYGALFADLTGHRLVAADGGAEGARDVMAGLCRLVGTHGSAVATISDALADGRVSPREAEAAMAALAGEKVAITALERQLVALKAGEG